MKKPLKIWPCPSEYLPCIIPEREPNHHNTGTTCSSGRVTVHSQQIQPLIFKFPHKQGEFLSLTVSVTRPVIQVASAAQTRRYSAPRRCYAPSRRTVRKSSRANCERLIVRCKCCNGLCRAWKGECLNLNWLVRHNWRTSPARCSFQVERNHCSRLFFKSNDVNTFISLYFRAIGILAIPANAGII